MNDIDRFNFSWFCKRFCSLLVKFPAELTPEILEKDDLCASYDVDEVYDALKAAHAFLTEIANELLHIPETNDDKYDKAKIIFSKFELMWALGFYGELYNENNEYVLHFNKQILKSINKNRYIPKNFGVAFENLKDNGCYVEYYSNEKIVKNFNMCDNGILHFDGNLVTLGLWLFIKKTAQKRWYWEDDKAGSYSNAEIIPILHCVEPYYRVDMRVFNSKDRLRYDIFEQMAGYNDNFIHYFKKIYDYIKDNYPQCMPGQGFYRYICCSVSFMVDRNHRMLGQLGIGHNENEIGFFTCLSGKEMKPFMERIDEFSRKVLGSHLLDLNCDCSSLKYTKEIVYRGEKYIFRDYTGKEFRFTVTSEEDVNQVLKIMEIKAKYNKNTL